MNEYVVLIVVGVCSGIGATIGQVLVRLWLEPYMQKLHEHSKKVIK